MIKNDCVMLVSRVALGNPFISYNPKEVGNMTKAPDGHESVIVESGHDPKQIVVFEGANCYPEYLVYYRRM